MAHTKCIGHVVLPGTPEHGTPEHRNITEHSGTSENQEHPQKTRNTPKKTRNTPRKPGTPQENQEHPPRKPETPQKMETMSSNLITAQRFARCVGIHFLS